MARLNEIPQPAEESIDALKRRFVRQNREIAKANSTQSLRIRTLEGEVSRLLSENVSLREQIIRLHYEIEAKAGSPDGDQVDLFRKKLETKLHELGDLVQELSEVQRNARRKERRNRKSTGRRSPKSSPNPRTWRNALTLSELTGGNDGRLPPILEDKCYPRQTLESNELREMLSDQANVTDSPDIGPPPVAHFEEGEPSVNSKDANDVFSKNGLSLNLETRKKRRESSLHSDSISTTPDSSEVANRDSKRATASLMDKPFKTGAKRKLTTRDDEDRQPLSETLDKDDFQFSRKNNNAASSKFHQDGNKSVTLKRTPAGDVKSQDTKMTASGTKARDTTEEPLPSLTDTASITGRKILGPKSTNIDPQSPIKAKGASLKDKPVDNNEHTASDRPSQHHRSSRARSNPSTLTKPKPSERLSQSTSAKIKTEVKIDDECLPVDLNSLSQAPETPHPLPLDFFSPVDAPSTIDNGASLGGRGDTPPPPDLSSDSSSFGRASRRSRGSVSYAEPNLRDKMRRPGKELVDAVISSGAASKSYGHSDSSSKPARPQGEEGEVVDVSSLIRNRFRNESTVDEDQESTYLRRERASTKSPLSEKTTALATVSASTDEQIALGARTNSTAPIGATTDLRQQRKTSTLTYGIVNKDRKGTAPSQTINSNQEEWDGVPPSHGTIATLIKPAQNGRAVRLKTETRSRVEDAVEPNEDGAMSEKTIEKHDSSRRGGEGEKPSQTDGDKRKDVNSLGRKRHTPSEAEESVFDFMGTPPSTSSTSERSNHDHDQQLDMGTTATTQRLSSRRRHSSAIVASTLGPSVGPDVSTTEAPATGHGRGLTKVGLSSKPISVTRKRPASATVPATANASISSVRNATDGTDGDIFARDGKTNIVSARGLRTTKSHASLSDGGHTGGDPSRTRYLQTRIGADVEEEDDDDDGDDDDENKDQELGKDVVACAGDEGIGQKDRGQSRRVREGRQQQERGSTVLRATAAAAAAAAAAAETGLGRGPGSGSGSGSGVGAGTGTGVGNNMTNTTTTRRRNSIMF